MPARIQYATTTDGVSIAYTVEGAGVPYVVVPPAPFAHREAEQRSPGYQGWYDLLGNGFRILRYDPRGCGLSDRESPGWTFEAFARDIDAVTAKAGFDTFVLTGISPGSPIAMYYAATRPDRVSHLILWCGAPSQAEGGTPQITALGPLQQIDWTMYTETLAYAMVAGVDAADEARAFAAIMREGTEPGAPVQAAWDLDATPYLGQIRAPTAVIHRKDVAIPPPAVARRLAGAIPNAELVLLEGAALLPWVGNRESAARAMCDFAGVELPLEPVPSRAVPAHPASLRTVLFTDIEGHTAMMQRLGDERGRHVLREHERLTREALLASGGSEVKTMGDGFLVSFPSATAAINCAIALQRSLAAHNAGGGEPLHVRAGINAGEPIAEGDDLFGSVVIAASRIAAKAKGGEVLVSDVVRQLVAGKQLLFHDRGLEELRGFEDPVRIWQLALEPSATTD